MTPEAAFTRIRKERCQWCAKGFLRTDDGRHIVKCVYFGPPASASNVSETCTAPSAEQLVEELAGKLAEARQVITEADAIISGEFGADWADHFGPFWEMLQKFKASVPA